MGGTDKEGLPGIGVSLAPQIDVGPDRDREHRIILWQRGGGYRMTHRVIIAATVTGHTILDLRSLNRTERGTFNAVTGLRNDVM